MLSMESKSSWRSQLPQPVREAGYESLALAWLVRVPRPKRDWLSD